jgi:hypothetical protein
MMLQVVWSLEHHHPDRWRIEMPEDLSALQAQVKKLESRLAICYVALMFCGAALLGFVIHDLHP